MKNEEITALKSTIDVQAKEIKLLQEKVDYLIRQKFASSSEKFPSNQPSLFEEEKSEVIEEDDPEVEHIETKRRKGGRRPIPKNIPITRVEHDISEADKVCECGECMVRMKAFSSFQYDVTPARFSAIENIRFVYACSAKCGAKVKTVPVAPSVLPRSQVTPSLLAMIGVQKFEDALPLSRQAKVFKQRFGVPFSDTTLSNWMIKASELRLTPIIDRLESCLLQCNYIQADETTLQVLKEKNKKAQSKSYLWLRVSQEREPIVLLHYSANRSGNTATSLFKGFKGHLQTDGYKGYNAVANSEGVTQLGCWAHARRKFADIVKSGVSDTESKLYAEEAIAMIAQLYKIEKEIKDFPPDQKLKIRKEKSGPIVEKIKTWLDDNFLKVQARSGAIAKAFGYLNNQFIKLSVFLEDGHLSIDNNNAERHVRPIAIGRKNWLFATSTKGAVALANWYSIIETAKANGLDPYQYLTHLFTQLPLYERDKMDIEPLLPWNVDLA